MFYLQRVTKDGLDSPHTFQTIEKLTHSLLIRNQTSAALEIAQMTEYPDTPTRILVPDALPAPCPECEREYEDNYGFYIWEVKDVRVSE